MAAELEERQGSQHGLEGVRVRPGRGLKVTGKILAFILSEMRSDG